MDKIKEVFWKIDTESQQIVWNLRRFFISLWNKMGKVPKRIVIYLVSLLGIAALYMIQHGLIWWWDKPEMSGLPYRASIAWLACIMYRAMDDFVLPGVPTYNLFRRNPVAYAIYLSGYAIIIAFVFQYA